jgi:hypothetical protein
MRAPWQKQSKLHSWYQNVGGKDYSLWKQYIDDIIQARQQLENLSAYVDDNTVYHEFFDE